MAEVKSEYTAGDLIAERYRVEKKLGRGGMGVVYLVDDTQTGEKRALKTLLPEYARDSNAVRRFTREVVAVRTLKHPGIVAIHDAQQIGDLMFYVMDYVAGKSLFQVVKERKKLGLGSTVRILSLLADALEYAHQYTIHRDISLDNVMVLSDGTVRLLDFGLAKLADNSGAFTQVGDRLGKWQYSAPEQVANPSAVDCRADIFSLGVMFYAMLAGRLPEIGQSLTQLVPDLPPCCDKFVDRATAMVPEGRFANAREFRIALMEVYEVYKGKREDVSFPSVKELSEQRAKEKGTSKKTKKDKKKRAEHKAPAQAKEQTAGTGPAIEKPKPRRRRKGAGFSLGAVLDKVRGLFRR